MVPFFGPPCIMSIWSVHRLTWVLKCWDLERKNTMMTVHTTSIEHGRTSVITSTTTINHDLYAVWFNLMHVGRPSNCSEPTVHRGNAARTRQMNVSETMTSLARRVVESVATLSGWTTAISRSTVIDTVIHADNNLQLNTNDNLFSDLFLVLAYYCYNNVE